MPILLGRFMSETLSQVCISSTFDYHYEWSAHMQHSNWNGVCLCMQ